MIAGTRIEIAAVLASHGDRAGAEPNCALMHHADAVRREAGLRTVTAGVLKGEPTLEEALRLAHESGAQRIVVYPLFMAEGYFTSSVLPDRIRRAGYAASSRLLAPLGLDRGLSALMLADALSTARDAALDPATSRLLVVGHGSKIGPAPAEAARKVADAIARKGRFAEVATAFLEESPYLDAQLSGEWAPTVVAGFFFGDGMHAGEDVPAAIRATGARAVYAGPIGHSPRVPALIAASLRAEMEIAAY
jgi:sirohydrochlorin ferrochelatase